VEKYLFKGKREKMNRIKNGTRVILKAISKTERMSDSKGVTLVELLVTLIITGFILTAAFEVYLNQQKGWIIQTQVSDMQQSARVAIRELTYKIRMAGYMLPNGIQAITPKNTNPDTITITFRNTELCGAPLEQNMSSASSALKCNGHDVSCFHNGEWAYVYDPNTLSGEFFYITNINYDSSWIEHGTALSKAYPKGSTVMKMEQIKYYIDNTTNPNLPCLMMKKTKQDSVIYATGIEDLQFVYTLADGSISNQPPSPNLIREVEITLIARTEKKDLQLEGDYRRRVLTSKVKVRNLGL
jgi:type II secretory pathway pseudopilin PulG